MWLCLYFLPVLEGEADIVGAVDGGVFHQRVPVFQFELGKRIRQGLEALDEGFNVGSLGLHPIQFRHDGLKALLGGFKALGQVVVAFRQGRRGHFRKWSAAPYPKAAAWPR